MPTPVAFVPCTTSIRDYYTNQLSLIGLLEIMSPINVTAEGQRLLSPFHVVTVWAVERSEFGQPFKQRIRLLGPDGQYISPENVVQLAPTHRIHRVFQRCDDPIPINTVGEFTFELQTAQVNSEDWATVARYPVLVPEVTFDQPARQLELPATAGPDPADPSP
jgi:hypothetical protein